VVLSVGSVGSSLFPLFRSCCLLLACLVANWFVLSFTFILIARLISEVNKESLIASSVVYLVVFDQYSLYN
jgi:hypothetical protein